MKFPRRTFLHLAAGAAALPAVSRVARAQAYPARPVRLILGYAPGNAPDIVAPLMGQWLSERLGQQFIIENRTGAGSNIGTEAVVRAAPDGYTLLYVTTANAVSATLFDKLNFNFIRDIAPVAGTIRVPNLVTVNPDLLISDGCDWSGVIAKLFAKSTRSTRKAGWRRALRGRIERILG
jgi:tripartite-type tricarboxylate transporter receptor subunit TctC